MAERPEIAYEKPIRDAVFTKPEKVGGRERVFVVPGTIHLGGAEPARTIRWSNKTGGPVKVWLASVAHLIYLVHPKNGQTLAEPIEVDPGDDLVVGVNPDMKECQYEYPVYSEAIKNFADGNSPPQMSCP